MKFDGSLPPWEAATLLSQLPPDSRYAAMATGGIEYWGWTVDRHIAASILDAVNSNTFAFVSANSKKKPKAPKPVARPGDAERKRKAKENNPFAVMVKKTMDKMRSGPKKIIIPEDNAKEA